MNTNELNYNEYLIACDNDRIRVEDRLSFDDYVKGAEDNYSHSF